MVCHFLFVELQCRSISCFRDSFLRRNLWWCYFVGLQCRSVSCFRQSFLRRNLWWCHFVFVELQCRSVSCFRDSFLRRNLWWRHFVGLQCRSVCLHIVSMFSLRMLAVCLSDMVRWQAVCQKSCPGSSSSRERRKRFIFAFSTCASSSTCMPSEFSDMFSVSSIIVQ